MTSSIDQWEGAKAQLVIGMTVSCVVVRHELFGFFVVIENTTAIGLIERVRMNQDGYSTPTDYPPIGARITATVLGFRDYSRQVELALPRKQFIKEEASKAEHIGMMEVENLRSRLPKS